jgi:para-nitrobenzyl esterase
VIPATDPRRSPTAAFTPVQRAIGGKKTIPVNITNFVRAETDLYFGRYAQSGSFGTLSHVRAMADVDRQRVVRMNRDTLYSSGVFDLDAAPLTIVLPESGRRFVSMQVVSQDHYTIGVVYAPGQFTFTRDTVGTRYVFVIVRTLANPHDPADMKAAHALQDAITVEQAASGSFEVPLWDKTSQDKVRSALEVLGSFGGTSAMFGSKDEVDPISYLIGAAIGWGGNPPYAAMYKSVFPIENDGRTVHTLTVKDVPVDGFWSVSVYNAKGYFEKNARGLYSLNNLTATPNDDDSFTLQFGGCQKTTPNCLPIVDGWNYTVRLYRARQELLDGSWTFPEAQPVR